MLVILDNETLIESASGFEFVQSPEDQRLLPGVADRIAELKAMGAIIVIVSNQGRVAAGHKSLKSAIAEMKHCLDLIPEIETVFFAHTYDGNHCYAVGSGLEDNHCQLSIGDYLSSEIGESDYLESEFFKLKDTGFFRKPNAGMLLLAMKDCEEIDVIMIGDRPKDQQAAEAAGIPFVDAEAWRSGKVAITPGAFIA